MFRLNLQKKLDKKGDKVRTSGVALINELFFNFYARMNKNTVEVHSSRLSTIEKLRNLALI